MRWNARTGSFGQRKITSLSKWSFSREGSTKISFRIIVDHLILEIHSQRSQIILGTCRIQHQAGGLGPSYSLGQAHTSSRGHSTSYQEIVPHSMKKPRASQRTTTLLLSSSSQDIRNSPSSNQTQACSTTSTKTSGSETS
jgi:hypothetical protein